MADHRDEPLVLGIETSCDETGVGIVHGTTLLADAVASSVDEHARFGGVVPEVASRAHLEAMVATIERALTDAGVKARDLDGIAVTAGPGLAGCPPGRRHRRQGVRLRAGQAPLRRQPPRLAHLRRPAGARAAARAHDGPAGQRRPLLAAALLRHHLRRAPARRHHRRRGRMRPSTRSPGSFSWASPAGPSSTGWPARATRRPSPSRAA